MKRGHKNSLTNISQEHLKSVLNYDPITGIFTWRSSQGAAKPGKPAGFKNGDRIKIGIDGNDYMAHRLAWLYMIGKWPEFEIDHKNRNKSDNRWKNLRHATSSQNHRNRGAQRNNTTGYKGVCFDKRAKKFTAGIKLKGRRYNLGLFTTAKEAHRAYVAAARRVHGTKWMCV